MRIRCSLLMLLSVLLAGCSASPNQAYLSQTVEAPAYSLGEEDGLPRALRVPLTLEKGYLFVDGQINGQRAGKMLLDTGSTLNILDTGVVERYGLKRVGGGEAVGIAGRESFGVHAVDSFAMAGLGLGVDRAAGLSLYQITRGFGMNVAGIVGSVSLLPHPFTIDYSQRELVVYQRDRFVPPADAERVRLEFYGGLPAVKATLANGREVLLIIDTGMDTALALPMEVAGWPGIVATGASGAGAARGVGGQIQTREAWLKSVAVFGHRLGGVPVTFEPETREPRRTDLPVGRIGGQLLRGFRLTFDARYRRLWCQFAGPAEGEGP